MEEDKIGLRTLFRCLARENNCIDVDKGANVCNQLRAISSRLMVRFDAYHSM